MKRVARLGILGGSFNPVHAGHLVIARRAIEALRLDRLLMIPSSDTPLKDPRSLAPARDRLAMLRLAVRGEKDIAASDLEVRRGGTSYTIDTVEALRPAFERCFLVIGADALASLARWRRLRDLAGLVTFAVASRPGHAPARLPAWIRTVRFPAPLLDISASELRSRIRGKMSVRHLVPDAVERYIRGRKLYA